MSLKMPLVLVAMFGMLASCIQAATANKFAKNAEVDSLVTALHRLETKFESQGAAMQAQLDAQQADILALKADSRGKEHQIEFIEGLLAHHALKLQLLSVQNGDQQTQIDHCSQRASKSSGGLQAAF